MGMRQKFLLNNLKSVRLVLANLMKVSFFSFFYFNSVLYKTRGEAARYGGRENGNGS